MPNLKPFKAFHPTENNCRDFPVKQIEHFSEEEIQAKIEGLSDSILKIIAPTFNSEADKIENYQIVRNNFLEALQNETLLEDSEVGFYIYQQKNEKENFVGIISLFDVNDVAKNKIRLHENTLTQRKKIFQEYLSEVHIQSEPVLLTYPENTKIEVLIQKEMNSKKLFSFTDAAENLHQVWRISNRLMLANFRETFEKMEALYVADGHHRLGSTIMYADEQKALDEEYIGNEPYNYVLGYALPNTSLKIYEFNRLVKDLNGLSTAEFLQKLEKNFTIVNKEKETYFPSHKHHISMYVEGNFYGLYINHELRGTPEGLGELDTYLFEELLAKPILDIQDSSLDDRIDFIKGTRNNEGILKMKEKVDSGKYKVGFGFYPIAFHDLKLISDLGLKMPPKSTYIEPKLLTGLLMYNMKK